MAEKKKKKKDDPFTVKCRKESAWLAEKLKELRNDTGLTQEQFAKELGLSLSCIRSCETNKVKIPFYVVSVYCEKLGLPPETFLPGMLDDSMSETEEWIDDNLCYLTIDQLHLIRELMESFLKITPSE